MKRLQLISGIVILAFASLICFEASKLSLGTPGKPGPGLFPLGLGALLFLIDVIFILRTATRWEGMGGSARALWAGLRWRQVPYALAALLAYSLLLDRLGYVICTWMLMVYFFWGGGAKRKWVAIIGAMVVSVVSFMIFRGMLKVRLPLGLLRL